MSNPLTLVRDNPLTVEGDSSEIISASSNLAVTDSSYSDAQLTYTITIPPTDGTLLDNGTPTTKFIQADLDNGLVSYLETAGQASSDDFFFSVSDPAGNTTPNTLFQIEILSYPVSETAPTHITVHADLSAPINDVQVVYNGSSSEQFTTVVTAGNGTLSASGVRTPQGTASVSGAGSNSLSISGTAAEVDAVLNTIGYTGASYGSDTLTVSTTDLGDNSSVSDQISVTIEPSANFTSLDDPLTTYPDTTATAINDQGEIVGWHYNVSGFLYSNGSWMELNDPQADGDSTWTEGINNLSQIVGYYENSSEVFNGFIYSNGTYTSYNDGNSNSGGTYFEGINNNGEVVGWTGKPTYAGAAAIPNSVGFIFENGSYDDFGPTGTQPAGINNSGAVSGTFFTTVEERAGISSVPVAVAEGFFYDDGTFSTFSNPSGNETFGEGINDADVIVGYYTTNAGTVGFAYDEPTGTWIPIVVPGATATYVYGINDSDQIVGAYADSNGNMHGFVGIVPPPFPANGGNNDEWVLSDGHWLASAQPGSIPSGYQVAGTGDFTGNGTSDILWQNPTAGDTQEWLLNNGGWAGTVDLGSHPGNYQIAGVGDFTGNGIDDVLWTSSSGGQVQTDIWELGSNGQWTASVSPGSHPAGYEVAGVGDFTGNGTDDVLWYDPTTGDVDEWQLSNGKWAASVDLGSHPGSGWTVAGVGDFTGNGIDDVLWTNSSSGQVQTDIWELGSNGKWAASVSPGSHPAGYQAAGIGDFTGNGTSDILWQNSSHRRH